MTTPFDTTRRMTNTQDILESSCPLCGGGNAALRYSFLPYRVVQCTACRVFYLNPRPRESDQRLLYESSAYYNGAASSGYSDYNSQEKALRSTFRRLLRELQSRNLTGGSLLDVGCGTGFFLDEARGYFGLRKGTEFSNQPAEEAERRSDGIWRGSVSSVPKTEKFDCITAIQVVEHVYEPLEFLKACCGRLKAGGRMLLVTPDIGSFWRYLFGRRWPSFKIPEHVVYFDRGTLSKLFHDAGFHRLIELPYPHAFPLSLVGRKLGIPMRLFGHRDVWLPATCVALCGFYEPENG